jgi:D-glycero-D-manno-heptose 1,7-bisphosphate phosphatase
MKTEAITVAPGQLKPALCVDLDGTIRYSLNGDFVNKPEDVALFPDVEEKLWEYRNKGWLIFGITNQGGVAYGFKTPADNDAEIEATCAAFGRNPFHIIKSCLHHPGGTREPYNHRSLFRKPQIGMLAMCEVEAWNNGIIVLWDQSVFVGDRPEDQECAENAGISFMWADDFFGRILA